MYSLQATSIVDALIAAGIPANAAQAIGDIFGKCNQPLVHRGPITQYGNTDFEGPVNFDQPPTGIDFPDPPPVQQQVTLCQLGSRLSAGGTASATTVDSQSITVTDAILLPGFDIETGAWITAVLVGDTWYSTEKAIVTTAILDADLLPTSTASAHIVATPFTVIQAADLGLIPTDFKLAAGTFCMLFNLPVDPTQWIVFAANPCAVPQ